MTDTLPSPRSFALATEDDLESLEAFLPSRDAICEARWPERYAKVSKAIELKESLLFHALKSSKRMNYKTGKTDYFVFGALEDGRNACIILEQIPVYFDVRVPTDIDKGDAESIDKYARVLSAYIGTAFNTDVTSTSIVHLLPFNGFSIEKVPFVRVYFKSVNDRNSVLYAIKERKKSNKNLNILDEWDISTSSDDTNYYIKTAREVRFDPAGWNTVSNWRKSWPDKEHVQGCSLVARVNISDISAIQAPPDANSMMVESWDIETYKHGDDGICPTPDDDYIIFVFGMAFSWYLDFTPFYSVAICTPSIGPVECDEGITLTVQCATERLALQAKLLFTRKFAPNFTAGFNTSEFDWPMTIAKIVRENLIDEFYNSYSLISSNKEVTRDLLYKYTFSSIDVKLDAETNLHCTHIANFEGKIDLDLYVLCRKDAPKDPNKSLNHFLSKAGLASKQDMPYIRMFHVFERAMMLLEAPIECHCDSHKDCLLCNNVITDLDCERDMSTTSEHIYTKKIKDSLVGLCCYCGKRPQNVQDMADVAYYCAIDCIRPLQLCYKKLFIPNAFSLAALSFTETRAAFYNANSARVFNLIGSECYKSDIAISSQYDTVPDTQKQWNQGAYVRQPNLGINRRRPISIIDFNSLYPHIIITYNLSPEKYVATREEAEELIERGYRVDQIGPFTQQIGLKNNVSTNERVERTGYFVSHNNTHIGGKIVDAWQKEIKVVCTMKDGSRVTIVAIDNLSKEQVATIRSAASWKRSYVFKPVFGRDALKGEAMGIFPTVLLLLMSMRNAVKKDLAVIEAALAECTDVDIKNATKFKWQLVDSKQYAIKILANTFYGASGKFNSPLYNCYVSGGTTDGGRKAILAVEKLLEHTLLCQPQYGDTDSMMTCAPERLFVEVDADKTLSPLEKASKMVAITSHYIDNIVLERVHDLMVAETGCIFLKMAREKTGIPSLFSAKKKYCMVQYEEGDGVAPVPGKNYIKGYEGVKSNQPKIMTYISDKFFKSALDVNCTEQPEQIIERIIREYYNETMSYEQFIRYASYRPHRKNLGVQTLIKRISLIHADASDPAVREAYEPPLPGAKFGYILAKREQKYTISGKIIDLKNGDYMELLRSFILLRGTPQEIEVDQEFYMRRYINGTLARFLSGEARFEPPADNERYNENTLLGYKAADKYRVDRAGKWIDELCDRYAIVTRKDVRNEGQLLRQRYASVVSDIRDEAIGILGRRAEALWYDLCIAKDKAKESWISKRATMDAMHAEVAACAFIKSIVGREKEVYTLYSGSELVKRAISYKTQECELLERIDNSITSLTYYTDLWRNEMEVILAKGGDSLKDMQWAEIKCILSSLISAIDDMYELNFNKARWNLICSKLAYIVANMMMAK